MICKNNPRHRYGSHLPTCPWCEREAQYGGAPPSQSQPAPTLPNLTRSGTKKALPLKGNAPPTISHKQRAKRSKVSHLLLNEESVSNEVTIIYLSVSSLIGIFYFIFYGSIYNEHGLFTGLMFCVASSIICEFICSIRLIISSLKEVIFSLILETSTIICMNLLALLNKQNEMLRSSHETALSIIILLSFLTVISLWLIYWIWFVCLIARVKWNRIDNIMP